MDLKFKVIINNQTSQMIINNRFGSPDSLNQCKKQKSAIKFNRKQQNLKGDRRKLEPFIDKIERICFISPNKNNNLPVNQQTDKQINSNRQQANQNFTGVKQQSYILANDMQLNDQKMNDSILSLMQQLTGANDKRYQAETNEYLMLIQNLRQEIDTLQNQNKLLKDKVKDMQMLQQFLIQRQTYISQVTDRNITLNQQLHQLQRQKEILNIEIRQIQNDYQNQNQMYEEYITNLKNQREIQKTDFDMILKLNMELNQKLQQKSNKRGERFKRNVRQKSEQIVESPRKQKKQIKKPNKQSAITQRSNIDISQTIQTKQTDLSQLNVKSVKSMDQYSILQKLNDQFDKCECKEIKKLRQKIRYNQIQIDILKRMKLSSEKLKGQNQKLKNHNKKLKAKLQHLNSKSINYKRSKNSDSSLQLSLSPKKG